MIDIKNMLNSLGMGIQNSLINTQNTINQGQLAYYAAQQQAFAQSQQYCIGINSAIYPGAAIHIPEREELWWEKIGATSYDYITDSAIMATGERVPCRLVEDGYNPCKSNVEWLDRQVNSVRVKL